MCTVCDGLAELAADGLCRCKKCTQVQWETGQLTRDLSWATKETTHIKLGKYSELEIVGGQDKIMGQVRYTSAAVSALQAAAYSHTCRQETGIEGPLTCTSAAIPIFLFVVVVIYSVCSLVPRAHLNCEGVLECMYTLHHLALNQGCVSLVYLIQKEKARGYKGSFSCCTLPQKMFS